MPWYSFTPTITPHEPQNPSQYTNVGTTPPSCIGNQKVCAIQALDQSGQPDITPALLGEIVQALNNNTNNTNVLLKN